MILRRFLAIVALFFVCPGGVTLAGHDGNTRVTFIETEGFESQGAMLTALLGEVREIHERGACEVLVLPVGIYEGAWMNDRLDEGGTPTEAAETAYRVWRESPAFLELLGYIAETKAAEEGIEVIGGLCRFHAAGKALHAAHVVEWFDAADPAILTREHRRLIQTSWAGRDRLSREPAVMRRRATELADALLDALDSKRDVLEAAHGERDVELQRQVLVNMARFVELEVMRSGDKPYDEAFDGEEKAENLRWFVSERYPGSAIVYVGGFEGLERELPEETEIARVLLTPGG